MGQIEEYQDVSEAEQRLAKRIERNVLAAELEVREWMAYVRAAQPELMRSAKHGHAEQLMELFEQWRLERPDDEQRMLLHISVLHQKWRNAPALAAVRQ